MKYFAFSPAMKMMLKSLFDEHICSGFKFCEATIISLKCLTVIVANCCSEIPLQSFLGGGVLKSVKSLGGIVCSWSQSCKILFFGVISFFVFLFFLALGNVTVQLNQIYQCSLVSLNLDI